MEWFELGLWWWFSEPRPRSPPLLIDGDDISDRREDCLEKKNPPETLAKRCTCGEPPDVHLLVEKTSRFPSLMHL